MRLARRLSWTTLAGGVLVLLYWALYLSGRISSGSADQARRTFESAFPFADAVLAGTLFAASWDLYRERRSGTFLLVMAGAMCLYLGIVDLTFCWRAGLYAPLTAAGMIELTVQSLCIGGGLAGLGSGWTMWNRDEMEPARSDHHHRGRSRASRYVRRVSLS